MSDTLRRGVIDRVKLDATDDKVLVAKFGHEDLSIGTQLIVNQSQEALLVKGGVALDLFGPGTHTLATDNIPLLRHLVNLPFGGRTPFTAEVWFVNRTAKRDLAWGTATPIQLRDPKTGMHVNMRAHGTWGVRVDDSRAFITQLVGTQLGADSDRVYGYFVGEITQRLSSVLAAAVVQDKISVFEMNAHLTTIAARVEQDLRPEFSRFGLEIVNFNLMRVSIPPDEYKKLQEISLAGMGQAYNTVRTFDVLEKAAANDGPAGDIMAAGVGIGMGMGAGASAGRMASLLAAAPVAAPTAGPAAGAVPAAADVASRLRRLKDILDDGLISAEDYEKKKLEILGAL